MKPRGRVIRCRLDQWLALSAAAQHCEYMHKTLTGLRRGAHTQVYRATLRGGGDVVAVKVQRPGATAALWLDAHVMRCVARALHHTAPRTLGRHHLVRLVDELVGRLFEELDYSLEAARQRQFRALYATSESQRRGVRLRVPAVYSQLCSTRVLVTEWVDGTRLTDSVAVRCPVTSPVTSPGLGSFSR